jgi:hypothetical protein
MGTRQLSHDSLPAQHAVAFGPDVGRLSLHDLPNRDLDARELRDLVASIASDPDRWAHLVGFDDNERVYASLHRDAHVDVWLLCWTPQNDTGWHDHDISSGAVAVVAGELVENNLAVATGGVETRIGAGHAFAFGPEHIHRLNGAERGVGLGARLLASAVADGSVRRERGRRAATGVGVLRRRAAPDRLGLVAGPARPGHSAARTAARSWAARRRSPAAPSP